MTLIWECPHCGNRQDFTWKGLPPGPIVCAKCAKTAVIKEAPAAVVTPTFDGETVGVEVEGKF